MGAEQGRGASDLAVQLPVDALFPASGIQGRRGRFSSSVRMVKRDLLRLFNLQHFSPSRNDGAQESISERVSPRITLSAADPHKSTCRFLRLRLRRSWSSIAGTAARVRSDTFSNCLE